MSVKRYVLDENALMGGIDMFEDDEGDYVLHSDYAALLARHNALREAVKEYFAMREANIDKMDHEEYREWFAKHIAFRADVDRLIANESAADCKGEG